MHRCLVAIVALSYVLASGCATSTTVKDASSKHASNLAELQQAVGEYRRKLDAYFDRLVQQQREAHIAMHVSLTIDDIAERQATSIAFEMHKNPNSQKPAEDFIKAGAGLTKAFVSGGDIFDQWVEKTEGNNLAERRQALEKKVTELEKAANAKNPPDADLLEKARKLRDEEVRKSDDKLTFIHVAIELKQQRAALNTQLDMLAAQVTTMQAFHAKINEFLATDATIDGAKIASAAEAGSKADVNGILRKK